MSLCRLTGRSFCAWCNHYRIFLLLPELFGVTHEGLPATLSSRTFVVLGLIRSSFVHLALTIACGSRFVFSYVCMASLTRTWMEGTILSPTFFLVLGRRCAVGTCVSVCLCVHVFCGVRLAFWACALLRGLPAGFPASTMLCNMTSLGALKPVSCCPACFIVAVICTGLHWP